MEVLVQEKNSFTRVLSVTVPEAQINEKYEEVLKNYKKEVSLPGFRPGKVPRDMIVQRFGKVMREEAVEKMVSAGFSDACKEKKIEPISRPLITKLEAKEGAPLCFEAEIEIEPQVKIEKYKDLGVQVTVAPVEDKEVDTVIAEIRDRLSVLKPVEREVKKGDYADIEYKKVIIGGEEKSDYQSPKYPVEIGESKQLQEFDRSFVGMKAGEEKTITFTFPEDYVYKEVAGKPAAFTVLLNSVKEKELPELNDEFAKGASPRAKTMDELKTIIHDDLAEEHERAGLNKAYSEAIDTLIEKNPFDIPGSRVASYLDYSWEDFKKQYPQTKATREEFDGKNRDAVLRDLKRYKILHAVADAEGLKPTQDEVDAEIRAYAESRGGEFEKFKAALKKSGQIMEIRESLREQKALDFLVGHTRKLKTADPKEA
ncbi:MAG: trigger factor [Fibrobacterota bacterium]